MKRVIVYVDGFNLYHAIDGLNDQTLKWLDLWSLSQKLINADQTLVAVKYFSAYATWKPNSYKRHRDYIQALEHQGVTTIMGQFKKRRLQCRASCREQFTTHEEKETDVAIGAHLIADTFTNAFDTAIIITADTDILAAIRLARGHTSPNQKIIVISPPNRFDRARDLAPIYAIPTSKLRQSLLPDHILTSPQPIARPDKYKTPISH